MISSEKLEKLHRIIDKMTDNDNDNKTKIIKILLTHLDDLYDEVIWLKEQNEETRYIIEDKKLENREPRRFGLLDTTQIPF